MNRSIRESAGKKLMIMKVSFLLLISICFYLNGNAQTYKVEIEDITNKIDIRTSSYQPRHRIEGSSLTSHEIGKALLKNNEMIKQLYTFLEEDINQSNSNPETLSKNGKYKAFIEGGWTDKDKKVIWFRMYAKSKIKEVIWDEGIIVNSWIFSNMMDKVMGNEPKYQNEKQRYFNGF